jgi:beta-glucosidase
MMDEEPYFTIIVNVKNIGAFAGKEVVQLYLADNLSTLAKPVKELKGFIKVALDPGEDKNVTFRLSRQDFASYNTDMEQWTAEPGLYTLLVGNSSRNITLSAKENVRGFNPYRYGPLSPAGKVLADPRTIYIRQKYLGSHIFTVDGLALTITYFGDTPIERYKVGM